MLKITGDGRKAALDMRLVNPVEQPDGETKLALAVQRIKNVRDESNGARSTQLVFCDLSTPDPTRFNVYDELRTRLAALRKDSPEVLVVQAGVDYPETAVIFATGSA